ncbi:hypothetical protein uan_083 [Pseudomonas phage UAntarctica]|nr:hypothetical protein uan_083 [Pseudomonas phage UAntarctica]
MIIHKPTGIGLTEVPLDRWQGPKATFRLDWDEATRRAEAIRGSIERSFGPQYADWAVNEMRSMLTAERPANLNKSILSVRVSRALKSL